MRSCNSNKFTFLLAFLAGAFVLNHAVVAIPISKATVQVLEDKQVVDVRAVRARQVTVPYGGPGTGHISRSLSRSRGRRQTDDTPPPPADPNGSDSLGANTATPVIPGQNDAATLPTSSSSSTTDGSTPESTAMATTTSQPLADPTGTATGTGSPTETGEGSVDPTGAGTQTETGTATGSPTDVPTGGGSTGSFPAPYFVVYNDLGPEPAPDPSTMKGWNVVNLAFWLTTGPLDMAPAWKSLDDANRKSLKQKYQQAGIKLLLSAFGETDKPTSSGKDPKEVGKQIADYVKETGLDGVDIDYEDFDAVTANTAADWLITLTKTLRQDLPKGKYLISHAPVAPWFAKGKLYDQVNKAVGDQIDWYNIQYYNQGPNVYTDCATMFDQSQDGTAVFQINKALGIPLEKLVVGKPAIEKDANNGYIDPSALGKCVAEAKGKGWNAGVMSWQYPNADAKWISAVRGSAFGGSTGSGYGTNSPTDGTPTAGEFEE